MLSKTDTLSFQGKEERDKGELKETLNSSLIIKQHLDAREEKVSASELNKWKFILYEACMHVCVFSVTFPFYWK